MLPGFGKNRKTRNGVEQIKNETGSEYLKKTVLMNFFKFDL